MKKLFIISVLSISHLTFFSQIKVFSGGSVTIGGTTSPYGVNHQIIGDKIAFSANSSAITSAPLIVGQNAVSSSPAFTFWGDHQTGIAHPANNVLGITIANSEKFRFNNNGQILNSNSSSSASTPDYSWSTDSNTGIFRAGSDILGFSSNGSERMRIDASGNIGIGTSSPSDKLHVSGSSRFNGRVQFDAWTDVILDWTNGYCCNMPFLWPETDWYFQIGDYAHAVGIEYIYSLYYKTGLYNVSDKNAKDNINYNVNAISKLKQLKPVTYNYKPSVYQGAPANVQSALVSKNHYGLIAQDVATVFPEFVEQDPKSGLYSVNYIEIIPLLVTAYNYQTLKLDSLQQQINNCCSKNNNRLLNPENGEGIEGTINTGSYIKQNIPNPFNKETTIEFFIAERGAQSSILVFDMAGKLLKTYKLNGSGNSTLNISANEYASGMYYYSLIVNNKEVDTKKMILTE